MSVSDIPTLGSWLAQLTLIIEGAWFRQPIRVTVGQSQCLWPQLRNVSRYCFDLDGTHSNSSGSGSELCSEVATHIHCLLPEADSGERPVRVMVGDQFIDGADVSRWGSGKPLTLRMAKPVVLHLISSSCDPSETPTTQLTGCPNNRPFDITVCSLNVDRLHGDIEPGIFVGDTRLDCTWDSWTRLYDDVSDCWNNTDLLCFRWRYCPTCLVLPTIVSTHNVLIQQSSQPGAATNAQQNANPATAASISFRGCPIGSLTNFTSDYSQRCVQCPLGHSTQNSTGQQSCQPCLAGTYAHALGSAYCLPCPVGTYAPTSGMAACLPCGGNQWQINTGASSCNECPLSKYRVDVSSCVDCPTGAICGYEGGGNYSIIADTGVWLLVDQSTGLVHPRDCASTACVSKEDGAGNGVVGQCIRLTDLQVVNTCAPGRRHAVGPDGQLNVLCSECIAGYSLLQGQCVPCTETHWGRLLFWTSLAFALVYLLHRFVDESIGGGSYVSIFFYFSQMSALFLVSEALPRFLGLAVFDWDWLTGVGLCTLPLNEHDKIGLKLLSPILMIMLQMLLVDIQLLMRASCLVFNRSSVLQKAYQVVFACQPQHPLSTTLSLHMRSGLRLWLLSFNTLSSVTFAFFNTEDKLEFGQRLRPSPSIEASSTVYKLLLPFVSLALVAVLCFPPLLLVYLTWLHRRQASVSAVGSSFETEVVKVVTVPYCPTHYYYSVMVLLRRLLLVAAYTFITSSTFVWLTFLKHVFLLLHVIAWPYKSAWENRTEALTLASLTLQTSILGAYPAVLGRPTVASAALWLLFIIPCLLILAISRRDTIVRLTDALLARSYICTMQLWTEVLRRRAAGAAAAVSLADAGGRLQLTRASSD